MLLLRRSVHRSENWQIVGTAKSSSSSGECTTCMQGTHRPSTASFGLVFFQSDKSKTYGWGPQEKLNYLKNVVVNWSFISCKSVRDVVREKTLQIMLSATNTLNVTN